MKGLCKQVPRGIGGVYTITRTKTGDCYVGASQDVRRRVLGAYIGSKLEAVAKQCHFSEFACRILIVCAPEHLNLYETLAVLALKPNYNTKPPAASFYWPEQENGPNRCKRVLKGGRPKSNGKKVGKK